MGDIRISYEMWDALRKRVEALELMHKPLGPSYETDITADALETEKLVSELKEKFNAEQRPIVPVDTTARVLVSGKPVPEDYSHTEINPATGQQKDYIVLTKEERSKGFVRPYRDAYRHLKCGKITTMSRAIAETYQRQPNFYGGTFCSTCRDHFPIGENGEFTWYEMDGTEGPKVGT